MRPVSGSLFRCSLHGVRFDALKSGAMLQPDWANIALLFAIARSPFRIFHMR